MNEIHHAPQHLLEAIPKPDRAATVTERFGIAQRGNCLLTRAALIEKRFSDRFEYERYRRCLGDPGSPFVAAAL
jgi:hypothetical protein